MQVQRAAITEGKAAILRLVRSPQPMAAEAVAMVVVLLQEVLVGAVEVSVQRVPLHPHQVQMAQEAEVVALPPQASML